MSDTDKAQEIENNVQPSSPPKKSSSKRLSSFERARVEGEELLKSLGVDSSLGGGRRTRSSTRGPAPPATPSPPPKRTRTSTPRKSKKAKQAEEEATHDDAPQTTEPSKKQAKAAKPDENNIDAADGTEQMEVDATSEQPQAVSQKPAATKPVPPVANVQPTANIQPPVVNQAPAETQSIVIQAPSDALPKVVIQPSNDKQPIVVIESSEPSPPAIEIADSNSPTMEIDEKPEEINLPQPATTNATPVVNENRSEPEKSSAESARVPVEPQPSKIPSPVAASAETVRKNVQVNNPPTTQLANNVQSETVTVNDVQPMETVSVTEESLQKIKKPIVSQTAPVVAADEPIPGHTTLVQTTAEKETVPDDVTTTASNGGDICNNVPPLNNEEMVKILDQQSLKPSGPITQIL